MAIPEVPEYNLLSNFTRAYLTRIISAGRKFDLMTFFYFQPLTGNEAVDERKLVRKEHLSRSLPPTLDIHIPRYLVVFVDCIGRRRDLFKEDASWHALERAVVMSTSYWRSDHDLSPLVTDINDNNFDAIYLISSIIPVRSTSIMNHSP